MKKAQRALVGLKLTFVVVLALAMAQLATIAVRMRIEPPPRTDLEMPAAAVTGAPASAEQTVGQTRVLLGTATPAMQPSPGASGQPGPSASNAPRGPAGPDPLQGLTLVGTMVGGSLSVAFFNNAQGKQVMLHTDESVGAWKVADIGEDEVVLAQGKDKRTVRLPSSQQGKSKGGNSSGDGEGMLPPPPVPVVANPPQGPGEKFLLAKGDVQAAVANPGEIMKDFRILPFQKDGRPFGSKVHYLKPGSFLTRLGLQPDDVLLNVNNRPVNGPDDFFMVWQALQKEDHTTINIDRGGRPVTVQVEIR